MSHGLPVAVGLCALSCLAPPAYGAPASFDPGKAAPYLEGGEAAGAIKLFRQQSWADAARAFEAYLKKRPKAADRLQATFLCAYAMSRAGRFSEAASRFDELVRSYPLLADHHRLYAARAWAADKQWASALERSLKVDPASPLDGDARMVRADSLRQLGRADDAEKGYREYLERYPTSWREPEVRFRIAELAAATPARWGEAREGYLAVDLRWPTDTWGKLAEERLKSKDPVALRLSGPDHLTRGMALFEQMRNTESEAEFHSALEVGGLSPKQACSAAYHMAQSVFKQRDRPRAAALFDGAVAGCQKALESDASTADLYVKALYQGGRCHAARSEPAAAIGCFERVEKEQPKHSYADDARLRRAEVYDGLAEKARAAAAKGTPWDGGMPEDHEAKSTGILSELAELYPSGDMKSEALFRLFFRAWKANRNEDARHWLDVALVKVPHEEGWWDAGRTLYWLGRIADREGKRDEARQSYERCARQYPLAYYALSALNRLREGWPKESAQFIASLRKPAPSAADLAWRFTARELFAQPGFLRGVELARLGLGAEARRELGAVGIRIQEGVKVQKVETPEGEELLWLVTVLYDRAGEHATSHWIPRHTLTAYEREWPAGPNRKRWLLSYPRGYKDLILEHTAKNGQPGALEFAVVREESGFDPLLESFANAIGLTQLTFPAAKRFAQGLPYTREALRDPVINVTIGARELGHLWGVYKENAPLAIAGYNAGEGAVNRWLRAAPAGQTLDEYIESIPYDETRGYTKRVLASYFAYRWLYDDGDGVPPLQLELPKR